LIFKPISPAGKKKRKKAKSLSLTFAKHQLELASALEGKSGLAKMLPPLILMLLLLPASASGATVPETPSGLACAAGGKSSELSCSFKPSAGASLYDVELALNATAWPFVSVTSALYEVTLTSLLPSKTYYARVRAHASEANGGGRQQMIIGWSNFSAPVHVQTQAAPLASARLGLRRRGGLDPAGPGSIEVAWTVPGEPSAQVCSLRYQLLAAADSAAAAVRSLDVPRAQGKALLTGLELGSAFDVSLRCGDGSDDSVAETEPLTLRTGQADTEWIEPLRVSENMMVWPDCTCASVSLLPYLPTAALRAQLPWC
jgi:hypothetical protein